MTDKTAFAHTKSGRPREEWHRLSHHLRSVAVLASASAGKFGSAPIGYLAGLWHDVGKYAPDWQEFLLEAGENAPDLGEETPAERRTQRKRGPDHSTAGALHARRILGRTPLARALSFVIASHHGGLPDLGDLEARMAEPSKAVRYESAIHEARDEVVENTEDAALPDFLDSNDSRERQMRRFEMFVRMLFSALVDADFLDTEAFINEGGRRESRTGWPSLADYVDPLARHLQTLGARSTASPSVLDARQRVLDWCRRAAGEERGAFSLTVPTGGGKSLASLSFALQHALAHGLDRVIIALPFISILDQTASVLRRIFEPLLGEKVLVEHHSNLVPEKDTLRNRVAAENWDAPLVVTTQVQLFESLFARRPSVCRKLHNLSNSVIILDEVQTLPVGLLDSILDALQELRSNYGTTLVLTTATQPSLHSRTFGLRRFHGLDPEPREIVPQEEIAPLFESLRRVTVEWPGEDSPVAWSGLAELIASHPQVLAIVDRRSDAATLWREVDARAEGAIHLSALMCPAHRRKVMQGIHERLSSGEECRVVSTQLVEAGVDVDFPVVYRAMAGLESLAQSAGRCNREGKRVSGSFRVFRSPNPPVGILKHHQEIAETMLRADRGLDLFAPATFRSYFDRLYSERDRDERAVQPSRQALEFEQTTAKFRMIDDATTTVFVPYDDLARIAIDDLRYAGPSRSTFRALQSYGVAVYPNALEALNGRGAIELLGDSAWVLLSLADYDSNLGLLVQNETSARFVI